LKIGPEYAEKRLFCRMSVTAELTYRIGSDDRIHRGQCRNLSHSGIQFQTDTCLQEGTTLEITIDTKSEKFKPMNALVEILRVVPVENNEYTVAGKILEYK
jgi:hypothetical protein